MKSPTPYIVVELIEREMKEQTGRLVLSDCGLTEIPEQVFELDWLTELVITNGYEQEEQFQQNTKRVLEPNLIREIPEGIARLKRLKKLKIGGYGTQAWPIESIDMLAFLTDLEAVDLSYNNIPSFAALVNSSDLKTLNLSHNNIWSIESLAFGFDHLEVLNLGANKLKGWLLKKGSKARRLKTLNLEQNEITDIEPFFDLEHLEELNLQDNNLVDLASLKNIETLKKLHLGRNKIQNLDLLKGLKNVQSLDLSSNEIETISPLTSLKKLETLGLSHNLISDINPLSSLTNLRQLYLGHNRFHLIYPISLLPNLEEVFLNDNKISDCPADIWQTNDIKQIKAHFDSSSREKSILADKKKRAKPTSKAIPPKVSSTNAKEALEESVAEVPMPESDIDDVKLIFVGNSGSGKTQLSKFFENGRLDKTRETTHGIRLNRWLPKGKVSEAFQALKNKIAANIWDFGGQEYYHGTFRLFLSNFAIYVLLWEQETNKNDVLETEIRKDESDMIQHYHYKYWLDNIRHYAPTSPHPDRSK